MMTASGLATRRFGCVEVLVGEASCLKEESSTWAVHELKKDAVNLMVITR